MKHVVQFSTGSSSAEVAWRVVEQYGTEDTVLLAADTLVEDEDNWRFGHEVAERLGVPITILADGRTPMEAGRDARVVPNNRMAVCSRVLKRDLLRKYIEETFDPDDTIIYLGFGWDEEFRLKNSQPHWEPWRIEAPLLAPPFIGHQELLDLWRERGIEPPRLYAAGFGHANCGGACVRGGQAQWKTLLGWNRDRYLEWEMEEEITRRELGKDVSILRDRRGGPVKPLTLRTFRERQEVNDQDYDQMDLGSACGCAEAMLGGAL